MKKEIIEKLREVEQLAKADGNLALQSIILSVMATVDIGVERELCMETSKFSQNMLNRMNEVKVQRN